MNSDDDEMATLKQAVAVTAEDYIEWLYNLRNQHPETFGKVADELVEPLEINVVFKKP